MAGILTKMAVAESRLDNADTRRVRIEADIRDLRKRVGWVGAIRIPAPSPWSKARGGGGECLSQPGWAACDPIHRTAYKADADTAQKFPCYLRAGGFSSPLSQPVTRPSFIGSSRSHVGQRSTRGPLPLDGLTMIIGCPQVGQSCC